jgi:hypothetical protein
MALRSASSFLDVSPDVAVIPAFIKRLAEVRSYDGPRGPGLQVMSFEAIQTMGTTQIPQMWQEVLKAGPKISERRMMALCAGTSCWCGIRPEQ